MLALISGSCLSAGAGCERGSQGRPFSAFPTIHRTVGIAVGDRLRTHFVAAAPQRRMGKYGFQKQKEHPNGMLFCLESGSCLSSHAVASTVLSVYEGLTSVFGMGTGGTPQLNHRNGQIPELSLFEYLDNCISNISFRFD